MTRAQLDELRALLGKATPGPWVGTPADNYVIEADGYPRKYGGRFPEDSTGFYLAIFGNHPSDYGEANRDIAVAAVNALPALLDEIERLRATLEEAEAGVELLGQLLGADPGWRYDATRKTASEWWTASAARNAMAGGE